MLYILLGGNFPLLYFLLQLLRLPDGFGLLVLLDGFVVQLVLEGLLQLH